LAIDPYIGEISIIAFPFAPVGWAICDGRLLLREDKAYIALYSLIGDTYGMGDGRTTFALPDLRGRLPLGAGQGPGLSPIVPGQQRGVEHRALQAQNLPSHTHEARFESDGVVPTAYSGGGTLTAPAGAVLANPVGEGGVTLPAFAPAVRANAGLAVLPVDGQVTIFPSGTSMPLDLCNPALGLNFIIAYAGIYPTRS
jgi:microcystin-dependent protein